MTRDQAMMRLAREAVGISIEDVNATLLACGIAPFSECEWERNWEAVTRWSLPELQQVLAALRERRPDK
jgi:hypothetical protein